MKYLLIILLLIVGCTNNMGGKYTGKIVEMKYNVYDHTDNYVDVIVGTETKRVIDTPYFDKLYNGDDVHIECTAGFFQKCYITGKAEK